MSMQRLLLLITVLVFAIALAFFTAERLGGTAACVVLGAVAGVVVALPLSVALGAVFAGMMYRRPSQQSNQPSSPMVIMPPAPDMEDGFLGPETFLGGRPRFTRPHSRTTFASGRSEKGFRIAGED